MVAAQPRSYDLLLPLITASRPFLPQSLDLNLWQRILLASFKSICLFPRNRSLISCSLTTLSVKQPCPPSALEAPVSHATEFRPRRYSGIFWVRFLEMPLQRKTEISPRPLVTCPPFLFSCVLECGSDCWSSSIRIEIWKTEKEMRKTQA